MTEARLAEQRRMLPSIAYSRLWENNWSAAGGDALTPQDIAAAFLDHLEPMTGNDRKRSWLFVAGVDLGLKRDGSAVVVLAVPRGGKAGKIRLASTKLWRPPPGGKIDLRAVERHILALDEQFGLECVGFDPWQAEHMAQTLEADSNRWRRNQKRFIGSEPFMREIPPTASNLREQAALVIESFGDRRLELYPCETLHRDLTKLRVEEKSYGLRLVSPRDGDGHGDTFSAFSLALLVAHDFAGRRVISAGGFVSDRLTPMERALRRFDARAAQFEREQMQPMEDEMADLKAVMRIAGRYRT